MGAGAVAGGLVVAGLARTGLLPFTVAAAGFGMAILAAALIPSLPGELAALGVVGFFSTAFMATGNTTLQLTGDPQFRGRVMALWSVTFTGSTPIGGPVVGVVADDLGPRYGLGLGAIACLAATVIGGLAVGRMPPADRYARRPRELDWPAYQQARNPRMIARRLVHWTFDSPLPSRVRLPRRPGRWSASRSSGRQGVPLAGIPVPVSAWFLSSARAPARDASSAIVALAASAGGTWRECR